MCGIVGFVDFDGGTTQREAKAICRDMLGQLKHRGPDAEGVWVSETGGIALGHRRLAIVDLSPTGAQPMISESGRYRITFNGEIYNFRSLRAELAHLGSAFRGTSDTEVLLATIETWGLTEALNRIRGMFALALWDQSTRTLHLARDPVGEKPLYYGVCGQSLLFASELKALRRYPGFQGRINKAAVEGLLRYGYVPTPLSIYEGIYKLVPGTVLTVDCSPQRRAPSISPLNTTATPDTIAPTPYWTARHAAQQGLSEPLTGGLDEAVSSLDTTLREVIGEQLSADVPVGAYLSGGIDSSAVVALMQGESRSPVRTFTVGFSEKEYNEAAYARAIAQHLGTEHTELTVDPQDALALIPRLPEIYDEPFADPSQIPTYLISRLARQHVTVCLSGDGGDELFCGYNRYLFSGKVANLGAALPSPVRRAAGSALRGLSPSQWDRLFRGAQRMAPFVSQFRRPNPGLKMHKLANALLASTPSDVYQSLISFWAHPEQAVLAEEDGGSDTVMAGLERLDNERHLIDSLMYWDLATYLPDDNLVKVDRASMAVSLETRLPLLDRRVIELSWRLPFELKVEGGVGKQALRRVLRRYVPDELIDRPKMGFSVPIDEWLRGPLRDWAEDLLDHSRLVSEGVFNADVVRERWERHLSGKRNHGLGLWAVLMFQAWYEREVADDQAVPESQRSLIV